MIVKQREANVVVVVVGALIVAVDAEMRGEDEKIIRKF